MLPVVLELSGTHSHEQQCVVSIIKLAAVGRQQTLSDPYGLCGQRSAHQGCRGAGLHHLVKHSSVVVNQGLATDEIRVRAHAVCRD
eukprot:272156-Rhodomonas_salina.1